MGGLEDGVAFLQANVWLMVVVAIAANVIFLGGCALSMRAPSDREQLAEFKNKATKGD
eukprot:m.229495 g.229495  ORF g.229495 m.229495 type:complete len:58 (-) comp26002_c0_seq6:524-697(-)